MTVYLLRAQRIYDYYNNANRSNRRGARAEARLPAKEDPSIASKRKKSLPQHFAKGWFRTVVKPGMEPYPEYVQRQKAIGGKILHPLAWRNEHIAHAWETSPPGLKAAVHVVKKLDETSFTYLHTMSPDQRRQHERELAADLVHTVVKVLVCAAEGEDSGDDDEFLDAEVDDILEELTEELYTNTLESLQQLARSDEEVEVEDLENIVKERQVSSTAAADDAADAGVNAPAAPSSSTPQPSAATVSVVSGSSTGDVPPVASAGASIEDVGGAAPTTVSSKPNGDETPMDVDRAAKDSADRLADLQRAALVIVRSYTELREGDKERSVTRTRVYVHFTDEHLQSDQGSAEQDPRLHPGPLRAWLFVRLDPRRSEHRRSRRDTSVSR